MKKLAIILVLFLVTFKINAQLLAVTKLNGRDLSYYSEISDTTDYEIKLSPYAKFWEGDTLFYQLNVDEDTLTTAEYLLDGLTPAGNNGLFISGSSARGYYPIQPVIDLGGYYKITSIKIYDYFGTDTINFAYGRPFHWSDTLSMYENANGLKSLDTAIYTRYLKVFYSNNGYQKIKELNLFGHLVRDSLSRTKPSISYYKPDFTMGQFIGFCQIAPLEVEQVGSTIRHYFNTEWIDTVTTVHNIDSIKFVFSSLHQPGEYTPPVKYYFPNGVGDGDPHADTSFHGTTWPQQTLDALKGAPLYIENQGLTKPIDTYNFPTRNTDSAGSYDRMSRLFWTYAAFYGDSIWPADSMQTPYPDISGQGTRKYIETGNEMNATWGTTELYYSPRQFEAYSSAVYDGNDGAMGPRMGVKNADSSMTVVMAGTAGVHYKYMRGIKYNSYYKRKNHTVPFDVVNIHTYPTTGINGEGNNKHAFSPEEYFKGGQLTNFVDSMRQLMPDKPIWLTEWGYDRNRASPVSVPPIAGLDSAQIQAQWVSRFWLLLSFSGIDRSTIFQLHNDPKSKPYDTLGTTKFNTMGLVDDYFVPGVGYSYYAFPAYYFQRTIWQQLYNYKPDSIIYQDHDSIWVYRYVNATHPDSVIYAIWSGTQTNRSTSQYAIKTGHDNTAVSLLKLADKEMDGITTSATTNATGEVPLTITETPQFIMTTKGTDGGQLADYTPPPATTVHKVLFYDGKAIIINSTQ